MCGIVGMAGSVGPKEREVFKDMLVACQVRGRDATGAISIGTDNSVGWVKTVGTPDRLFEMKGFDRNVDRFMAKVLVGHCRSKTIGENTHQNAHPFDHENVIGVHNGTLNHSWKRDRSSDGYKVDSDWLLSQISEKGVENVIPEIEGAWTLVWWDKRNNTINFLRNEERPLFFAWSVDKKTMFWASEPWMLHGIVGRQIKLAELESGFNTCKLAENEMWSFEVDKVTGFKARPFMKIEGKKVASNFTMNEYHGNAHNGTWRRPDIPVLPAIGTPDNAATAAIRRIDAAVAARAAGGSGVTGPFQGQAPRYLLEELGARIDTANARLPGLPMPLRRNGVPSMPNSKQPNEETLTEQACDSFQKDCKLPSASPTESKSTPTSSKIVTSRPVLRLISSPTTNNGGSSNVRTLPSLNGSVLSPLIDLRRVGSLWYITDRKSGTEWSEIDFAANTSRICSWCRSVDNDLKDVHEFVDPWNFVCNECDKDQFPVHQHN